ncbi:DUF2948 family protein [Kiloniella laminariae]|uniref:DUF2948 family protein n=1 Tax=Kiloniella laminariae TaxID=454162 RepID=UPI000362410B|nr:DUF2948 family protein [Kiloniella laminariae]
MAEGTRLKIRAQDDEDIRTLSGLLQDSLVPLCDVAWLREEKRFVMVVNRFCWEMLPAEIRARGFSAPDSPDEIVAAKEEIKADSRDDDDDDVAFADVAPLPTFHRVNTGLCFDRVKSIQVKNVDLGQKDEILNLLTIAAIPGYITLYFSGGAAIRLVVSQIRCHMDDLSEPWPTLNQPRHDVEDQLADAAAGFTDHGQNDHGQNDHGLGARSPKEV